MFDGQSGEWLARIAEAGEEAHDAHRRAANARARRAIPDVWLAFAPVKRAQTDWLVEKATELGAARLIPVMTQRTIAERVKLERLEAIAIEAAEQCGRTRLPEIAEPVTPQAVARRRAIRARRLYFADEGGGEPAGERLQAGARADPDRPRRRLHRGGARRWSARRPTPCPISLGPRILRAETAALAALAAFMAIAGDWPELMVDLDVDRPRCGENDRDHRFRASAAGIMQAESPWGTGEERSVPFKFGPRVARQGFARTSRQGSN